MKQVLLKSFILINNINDITKWQMNNFLKSTMTYMTNDLL